MSLTTSQILALPTIPEDTTGIATDKVREYRSLMQASQQLAKKGKIDAANMFREKAESLLK